MIVPVMNMEVVSIPSKECECDGFGMGVRGYIAYVENEDQFLVKAHDVDQAFWHCRKCVEKLK